MNLMTDPEEPQGDNGFLLYVPVILWQRRWFIIVPLVLGILGAILANLLIPTAYRSSALMLVQSSQVSSGLGDDEQEVVDRRIARITQQITSRPDLIALIEKHGLYKNLRGRKPLSEILDRMREDITLTPTSVDQANPAANQRTIAFRLSFDYPVAELAQVTAQDLVQRIVELDSSGTSLGAARRVDFLTEQARGLQGQISSIQGKIANISAEAGGILSNSNMLPGSGSFGSYDVQIAALQRDNASLISQKETASKSDTRDPVVIAAETQLAAAKAVYSENHPDVVIAEQRLAEARKLAKSNTQKLPLEAIDQQITFNNSQIAALRSAKGQEMAQANSARSAQARAPVVQVQISDLQQQLTGVNDQYRAVSDKLLAARAAARAEDEQVGERLTVVDPPVVPDAPVRPNRWLIAALGIAGGLGVGIVLALAVEMMMQPIRDPAALSAIVGSAPLVTVPVISAAQGPGSGRKQRWLRWLSRSATEIP